MKKILIAVITLMLTLALLTGAACAEEAAEAEKSFGDIFADRGVEFEPSVFPDLDYYAYANSTEEGFIESQEFGVNGSLICEMVQTIYYPTDGMTDEEKATVYYLMMMTFEIANMEEFCEVTYEQMDNCLKITNHFSGMDVTENVKRMGELGFVTAGADALAIQFVEQSLMANGYLKSEASVSID